MEARVGIEPTHKGFADLSLTTWVPRLSLSSITKLRDVCQRKPGSFYSIHTGLVNLRESRRRTHAFLVHFFAGSSICASRKNRADSSGGVGLM